MRSILLAREQLTHRYMPATARPAATTYPIVRLRPPYDPADLCAAGPDLGRIPELPGTVVGVDLARSTVELEPLRDLLPDLSRRAPSCPVVVFLTMPAEKALATIARLASLRVRAVLPLGPSLPSLLREVLTDPARLPAGVVDWLQDRSIRLNPNQADLLRRILSGAPRHADLGSLLEDVGIPCTSARFRLRKRRLPSPGRWFQLARALHAALLLQRHPEFTVARVAYQLGFADHSALAHLLRRSCGVGTREARAALGWEWLLHRWFTSGRKPA